MIFIFIGYTSSSQNVSTRLDMNNESSHFELIVGQTGQHKMCQVPSLLMLTTLLPNPQPQIRIRPFFPPSNPINSSNPLQFPRDMFSFNWLLLFIISFK